MLINLSGYIAMLLCVLCWSTSGLFIKLIDWHPLVISCIRSAIAALFMLAVQGRSMFAPSSWKTGMTRVYGLPTLLLASLASAATKILYVTANKLTSPANAILLQHSAPIWAALLGWFLIGEKLRKAQWVSLGMVITGIFLFLFDGVTYGGILGDGVALLCGLTFAFSMVFLRMQKEGSPALALFFSHLIPVIIGLPFLFTHPPRWTPLATGSIVFLGLVQIGVASLLYAYSIKRIQAIEGMLVAQLEPVLNPVWVFIFSGEIPSFFAILGGGVILGAVLIAALQKKTDTKGFPPQKAQWFPLFQHIGKKTVLVVGGGAIALRRVKSLLHFDCTIHIIAQDICAGLTKLIPEHEGVITLEQRAFRPGDCTQGEQPFLVIAGTNSRETNHGVAEECKTQGIPVSVADCKEESTCYFPALVMDGAIVAAITSDGADHHAVREAAEKIRAVLGNGNPGAIKY